MGRRQAGTAPDFDSGMRRFESCRPNVTKNKQAASPPPFSKNCAINEQTGNGRVVGRCWFYVGEKDVCPRHGDVKAPMDRYRATGKLTLERDFERKYIVGSPCD